MIVNTAVTIDNKAYSKIILHCVKHPVNDCYGVLLGKTSEEGFTVTDAIPLFHDRIFAPQLEVALKFIELFHEKEKNVSVIGMYENLIMNNDIDPKNVAVSSYASFLADNIHNKKIKMPLIFEIFSRESDSSGDSDRKKSEINFEIFRYTGLNEKSEFVSFYSETSSQFNLVKKLLGEFKENEIVDFDDHFLEANLDWRNNFIDTYIN